MMRRIAVVGDRLSNGGEVCNYEGVNFKLGNGVHQVALINGPAYCRLCRSTGYVAKHGGPRRMTIGIGEVALDKDWIVCDCPEHPQIDAQLSGETWYDDLSDTLRPVRPTSRLRH